VEECQRKADGRGKELSECPKVVSFSGRGNCFSLIGGRQGVGKSHIYVPASRSRYKNEVKPILSKGPSGESRLNGGETSRGPVSSSWNDECFKEKGSGRKPVKTPQDKMV